MILKNALLLGLLGSIELALAAEVSELEWMSGCWSIQGKESGSGEMWTRPMGNMLLGIGYIAKDGKVGSYEYMRVEKRQSGDIYFVAKPSEQTETEFKMTKMSKRNIVFENPTHDFPQRISYRLESEGIMKAKIEAKEGDDFKGFELTMLHLQCKE